MPAATCGSITFNNHPGPPGNRPRCHCHHQGDGAWWSAPENSELDSKWMEVTQDCILKWLRLKFGSMTFETPQTILQSCIKKCLNLCYQAYFMVKFKLLHTWGGPHLSNCWHVSITLDLLGRGQHWKRHRTLQKQLDIQDNSQLMQI